MKAKNYTDNIQNRLKRSREMIELSQADFAKVLKISRSTLIRIETGKQSPTIHQIEQISEITGVNFEYLVLGKEPLQQALEEIDMIKSTYNKQAYALDQILNSRIDQLRANYINRYGHPEQEYPIKK